MTIAVDSPVNNLLKQYQHLVETVGEKMNLVAKRDVGDIIHNLIYESLYPLEWEVCRLASPLLDIGSGAGIPGIPLKIVRPDLCVVLLEAKRKKALFLRNAITMLKLSDADAVCDRAEELMRNPQYINHFNCVVSRAVTDLRNLLRWSSILLKPKGELIVWKGSQLQDELKQLDASGWSGPLLKSFPGGLTLVRFEKQSFQP